MEKILDRLSFDDFQMKFQDYRQTGACQCLDEQETAAYKKLTEALGDQKKPLDEWVNAICEQYCMERAEAFRKGFALAVRLFLEAAEEQI